MGSDATRARTACVDQRMSAGVQLGDTALNSLFPGRGPKARSGRLGLCGRCRYSFFNPKRANHERTKGLPRWSSRLTVEKCLCLINEALHGAGVFKTVAGSYWTWKWRSPDRGETLSLVITVVEVTGPAMGLRLCRECGKLTYLAPTKT